MTPTRKLAQVLDSTHSNNPTWVPYRRSSHTLFSFIPFNIQISTFIGFSMLLLSYTTTTTTIIMKITKRKQCTATTMVTTMTATMQMTILLWWFCDTWAYHGRWRQWIRYHNSIRTHVQTRCRSDQECLVEEDKCHAGTFLDVAQSRWPCGVGPLDKSSVLPCVPTAAVIAPLIWTEISIRNSPV